MLSAPILVERFVTTSEMSRDLEIAGRPMSRVRIQRRVRAVVAEHGPGDWYRRSGHGKGARELISPERLRAAHPWFFAVGARTEISLSADEKIRALENDVRELRRGRAKDGKRFRELWDACHQWFSHATEMAVPQSVTVSDGE